MPDPMDLNRETWDHFAEHHAQTLSDVYDVPAFQAGACTLDPIEIEELGDVPGKRLLHLQCHFGMDTLSWARRGAKVVGVDFSPKAIEIAQGLAAQTNLPAEFVCCNVYDTPEHVPGRFDVVFTSAGVLCWLPDLERWARVVADMLAPGGTFYIREFHPVENLLERDTPEPRFDPNAVASDAPMLFPLDVASYGGAPPRDDLTSAEWLHSMGQIVTALAGAGLRIEFLHEFPFTTYRALDWLQRESAGRWAPPEGVPPVPLMFSLRATKEPACTS